MPWFKHDIGPQVFASPMGGVPAELPPWEWAAGDPVSCGRVSALFGALYGGVGVLAVLWGLAFFGVVSINWPPVAGPAQLLETLLPLLGLLTLITVLPRRTAMIASLGFSPVGLSLRLAFPFGSARSPVIPWSQVRRITAESVELDGMGFVNPKYKLTPYQSSRLGSFLGRGRPSI